MAFLRSSPNSELFGNALDAYGDRSIYAPEKTRALFQRAKALRRLKRDIEAQQDEEKCMELYSELVPDHEQTVSELLDSDLDKRIVFWSR